MEHGNLQKSMGKSWASDERRGNRYSSAAYSKLAKGKSLNAISTSPFLMIFMSVRVKVLQKGKITIPIELRKRLAIREGDYLTLETRGGSLILRPPKTVSNPTDLLTDLAEGVAVEERVKDELRKAAATRLEKKLTRIPL